MAPEQKASVHIGEIQAKGQVVLLSGELLHALICQGELQP